VRAAELDLDLDVFAGPFDLLMAIVLRDEISLAEVQLGEIVVAYLEHLDEAGELDLEAATEFLVLIASLLELKSRLLLPSAEEEEVQLGPQEAADELLARMLEYRRYREAAAHLSALFAAGSG
jgi:segregation and condensation protein A